MDKVQLGTTDLIVSRLCFGCWQLSPRFWGEISIPEWEKALDAAVDSGINFIDTASAYGEGGAEEALGAYLKRRGKHDDLVIATKYFWNFSKGDRVPDTSYEYIIRECEDSLRRLGVETIDLWQMHSWDPLTQPEEVATALYQLRKQGKVRWFGVSNLNAEQMRMYSEFFTIDCLQPPYSLVTRNVEARELPLCLEKRIGVIPYSPLFRGLLTNKYKPGTQFEDTRNEAPLFKESALAVLKPAMDSLEPIRKKYDLSMAQLAIRWVLTHPAITSAIVGIKTADHVETIIKAADGILERPDWHHVAKVLDDARIKALKSVG